MSFAARLKQGLLEKDIRAKDLAEAIGRTKASITLYLQGKNIPRRDIQEKIASVLDCTVDWLNSEDEVEIGLKRVTVADTARLLGVNEQSVRCALQQGRAPYGYACIGTGKRYTYHISPKKLAEYIGDF